MMKDHERYTDKTAGKAIRRAHHRGDMIIHPLAYRIGEVPGFLVILK